MTQDHILQLKHDWKWDKEDLVVTKLNPGPYKDNVHSDEIAKKEQLEIVQLTDE